MLSVLVRSEEREDLLLIEFNANLEVKNEDPQVLVRSLPSLMSLLSVHPRRRQLRDPLPEEQQEGRSSVFGL